MCAVLRVSWVKMCLPQTLVKCYMEVYYVTFGARFKWSGFDMSVLHLHFLASEVAAWLRWPALLLVDDI